MTARAARLLVLLAAAAVPAWAAERIVLRPDMLPPPDEEASVSNPSRTVPRPEGTMPAVPPGFVISLYADKLEHARWLAVGEGGDVFLAESNAGKITLLADRSGSGRADTVTTFADGFDKPHGMAVHNGFLYVADTERVWRLPYRLGTPRAAGPREAVTERDSLGDSRGHWTRGLAISPDGQRMLVGIGSKNNIGVEEPPRATVREFGIDGKLLGTFASGLRNPVGIAFQPGTDNLYVVVNERDGLGDELVPDYLTRVQRGGFYGWPYSYIGSHPQPGFARKRPDLVARAIVPDVLFRSHSAPLGLAFHTGTQFPAEYRDDAFVGLHGSWNAAEPRGYMVARIPFKDGKPEGGYEPFVTGFRLGDSGRAEVFGRPVGVAVARDGSLLIADDAGQAVWRVRYVGGK